MLKLIFLEIDIHIIQNSKRQNIFTGVDQLRIKIFNIHLIKYNFKSQIQQTLVVLVQFKLSARAFKIIIGFGAQAIVLPHPHSNYPP